MREPARSFMPRKSTKDRVIRYAVIGLGHIAQSVVLPGFANAKNSELAALVTGDRKKATALSKKYGVPSVGYEALEQVLEEQAIDAAYIALPNMLHREFTERVARAGVHVLCEKPMATTDQDCRKMIAACEKAKVLLMIAYRMHFTEADLKAIALARSGKLGELRYLSSVFGMQVASPNIRIDQSAGGGPLYDLGVYCINAARYLFGSEPTEVLGFLASNKDPRFRETEEMANALLRFPKDRLAAFTCSFGASDNAVIELVGTKGTLKIDPAYSYQEPIEWTVSTGGKKRTKTFELTDQFGAELAYFSGCVQAGKKPEPDGYEGYADVRIMNAIFKAARTGKAVKIPPVKRQSAPKLAQMFKLTHKPPPRLLNVKAPTRA